MIGAQGELLTDDDNIDKLFDSVNDLLEATDEDATTSTSTTTSKSVIPGKGNNSVWVNRLERLNINIGI